MNVAQTKIRSLIHHLSQSLPSSLMKLGFDEHEVLHRLKHFLPSCTEKSSCTAIATSFHDKFDLGAFSDIYRWHRHFRRSRFHFTSLHDTKTRQHSVMIATTLMPLSNLGLPFSFFLPVLEQPTFQSRQPSSAKISFYLISMKNNSSLPASSLFPLFSMALL